MDRCIVVESYWPFRHKVGRASPYTRRTGALLYFSLSLSLSLSLSHPRRERGREERDGERERRERGERRERERDERDERERERETDHTQHAMAEMSERPIDQEMKNALGNDSLHSASRRSGESGEYWNSMGETQLCEDIFYLLRAAFTAIDQVIC